MYIMKKINRYLLKRQLEDTLKKETLSKNILLSLIHDGTLVLDKYSIYELIKIKKKISNVENKLNKLNKRKKEKL